MNRSWRIVASSLAAGVVLTLAGQAHAQGSDAVLDLLVRKGIITDKELKELKAQADADLMRAMERQNKSKVSSWIDSMTWSGDLRLRGEYFDNEDLGPDTVDRWRFRYRLRLGFVSKFNEWATFGFRLAGGNLEGDPVSTNETLDDTFANDTINIDLAYITLQPSFAKWMAVTGGKMNNPVWQTGISSPVQYDNDVTPEGVAEQLSFSVGDKQQHKLFFNMGQFVPNEFASDSNDPFLLEFQGGLQMAFGADVKKPVVRVTVAGGYTHTRNFDLMKPGTANKGSGNLGNAVSGGFFLDDFEILSARAELAWKITDKKFLGITPVVTLSGEYFENIADAYEDSALIAVDPGQTTAYTGQIKFGGAKKKGEWEVAYQYKYVEADAVWDAVSDSDWGSSGGTDRKGHVFKGAYNFFEWWQLGLTAFITEKISDRTAAHSQKGIPGEELLRVQIDSQFKF
jgi:hypothetical protein